MSLGVSQESKYPTDPLEPLVLLSASRAGSAGPGPVKASAYCSLSKGLEWLRFNKATQRMNVILPSRFFSIIVGPNATQCTVGKVRRKKKQRQTETVLDR